ncbi:phage shock protein A [Desulfonema ishimotonii]|uniref:Phage shock protein A n=1 Tax=Desulfonema ishimotonii TaxID=45657 RepID=A0A401FTJ3_9BACT|nr:PspA/IM30 family protein [Desulfonema ishimotonii]GBC60274.1 phage shock protein A [Desulfonema ishimotonii]
MSILTRMIRLWKADIHGVMDQLEDKPLLLNQYLRDMEAALAHNEAELNRLVASRNQARQSHEKYTAEIETLENDLDAAIERDKDDIARFLIKKRRPLSRHREDLERHIRTLEQEIAQCRENLDSRKLEYERLRLRAGEYLRKSEQTNREQDLSGIYTESASETPCEEEIELELLRRKEARKGGIKQ